MSSGEEYTQVLIPDKTVVISRDRRTMLPSMGKSSFNNDDNSRWLSLLAVFLTGVIAVLATVAVVRYEGKIGEYETRITELETDLDTFFQVLSEEIDYERDHHRSKVSTTHANNGKKKTGEVPNEEEQWRLMGEELEHKLHPNRKPEQEAGKLRRKRQVLDDVPRFPYLPNSFGTDVERSDDGIPIVDRSYQVSSVNTGRRSSAGGRFVGAPVVSPTPDSEGLRLYEGLVETGGRNEPKSLDFGGSSNNNDELSPLLPHHKVSAAWSEKGASNPPSRLQLRSGDSENVDRYGGPRFANELTYTRSRPTSRYTGPARPTTRPVSSSRPQAGATYHRNSRVAATYSSGIDNYGGGGGARVAPTAASRTTRRRKVNQGGVEEYPPLRTMGYGQGEVIARVIQDEDRQPQQQYQQQRHSQQVWGGDRKPGALRSQQQQQYLSRRPVETFRRPVAPPTEHPSGYSERSGPLNVTINRSVPFGTYYSSARGNWDTNTYQQQTQRYSNRY